MDDEIEKLIKELEYAVGVILAPPNLVTPEQRKASESVVLCFQKTPISLEVCCTILERSSHDFVLFEIAGVMKSTLIRVWSSLSRENIIALRQYLIRYMINKPNLAGFVRERLVQIFAIIVKRGNVDTDGAERRQILEELENIIRNGDSPKQILACSIILAIMQEYATTVRSADVGLTWEIHTQAKKQFQTSDLKKIMKFCYEILSLIARDEAIIKEQIPLVNKLLEISETILRWCFVCNTSRYFDDAFEYLVKTQDFPLVRLDETWKDVILDPAVINLYFTIYWKIRDSSASEHGLRCLVQFGAIRGYVLLDEDDKNRYYTNYIHNLLQLISMMNVTEHEVIGVANMFNKPLANIDPKTFFNLDKNMAVTFLEQVTRLTCFFVQSGSQSSFAEDCSYTKAFECILRAWHAILNAQEFFAEQIFEQSLIQLFNVYIQCHLSAPDGIRRIEDNDLISEEINANEDDDRTKFLQQLQTIGQLGRIILDYSLPLLAKLLEDRTNKLREQLNRLASEPNILNNSNSVVNNLYEDLHWLVLVSGHVLCMESPGEEPLIPGQITKYCMKQAQSGQVDVNISMQLLASPQMNIPDIAEAEQKSDHVIRLIASIFRLCEIEKVAILANYSYILSPELGSTIVWFLHRWSLCYLIPKEYYYTEISATLLQAFGQDSPGALWTFNFLLDKIQSNISTFKCEPSLIKETLDLLTVLVKSKEKCSYVLKSDHCTSLIDLATKIQTDFTSDTKRKLMNAALNIGLAYPDKEDRIRFWEQLLGPLRGNFRHIISNESFVKMYDTETVRIQITSIYESLIGIFDDNLRKTATSPEIYPYYIDLLNEIPRLLSLYHNYQQLVQLFLEVMYQCVTSGILSIPNELKVQRTQVLKIYVDLMKTYAQNNSSRITSDVTAEEDAYQDILLFMKILTRLTKDSLIEDEAELDIPSVILYGLNIIIPMMTEDLFKFPTLCQQYYKMLTSFCQNYPEQVIIMDPNLLEKVLTSIGLGLYLFDHQVSTLCCDFIRTLTSNMFIREKQRTEIAAFLPLMFELILERRVNMDVVPHMSTPIFCLIKLFPEKYQEVAQTFIQANPNHAERLKEAFTELTSNLHMNVQKSQSFKFDSNFDKFITNLQGFLMVK